MDATTANRHSGGCYCGTLRYATVLDGSVAGQCHCRACQHVAGGGPQYFQLVMPESFEWVSGQPRSYTKIALADPVTRFFCGDCGTHVLTRRSDQRALVLKVGTLDDPSYFRPRVAICMDEAQPFHTVADGVATFDGIPRAR